MTLESPSLRDAAYRQAEDMKLLQDLAKKTRNNIIGAYHTFAAYLEERYEREPTTADYTYRNLEDYFRDVVSTMTGGTYRTKRSQHVTIVKWLMKRGYLAWGPNIAEDLPVRRTTATTTRERRFSDEELLKFLAAAKRSHSRDYYLVLFMVLTGRRIGEVLGDKEADQVGIMWGDIRWDENVILFNNYKGRKHGEEMPLTARLRAVLEAWREAYCKQLGVTDVLNNWYVFPALTGVGQSSRGHKRRRVVSPEYEATNSDRIFRELMDAAQLGRRRGDGWHIFRKTFALQRKKKAREMGRVDAMELTKNALGHTDEKTTRIYTGANEERERYTEWAMGAEELSLAAMAKIPELSALAAEALAAPETQQEPASGSDVDTGRVDPFYAGSSVIDIATARRRRLLA